MWSREQNKLMRWRTKWFSIKYSGGTEKDTKKARPSNTRITGNAQNIRQKNAAEERFLFNVNVKIINATLTLLLKVPTQKVRFSLHKNKISKTNFKSFPNQRSDFFFLHIHKTSKHLFMLSISFQSHLIRYSGTGRTFKDNQRALEHLRHSESTGALGHSEGTQKALGGHLGTWALGHSGTRGLKALWHSDT